ncbi:MAG TPA: hypothetical protein VG479_11920 [Gaiellaceae bacterium]|nr:hypothetical protein [Gaiellaceae bacterium]
MATPPTDAAPEPEPEPEARKPLRDRALGRVLMLLAVLLLAFISLKTCASRGDEISYQEAEKIARDEVDFEPTKVLVRGIQRGLDAHLFWAVSLSRTNAAGLRVDCATVLVDSETGDAETEPC